jgi:hypothetical protein
LRSKALKSVASCDDAKRAAGVEEASALQLREKL